MTGTGTQADPYVPSTWAEFVTAIGTSSAYIALAEGTVWDMNDIAPTGTGTITVQAANVEGNGAEVRNLFFTGGGFKFQASSVFNNIKFSNLLAENGAVVFGCNAGTDWIYPQLKLTTISGKLVDSTLLSAPNGVSGQRQKITVSQTAINIEFSGNSAFVVNGSGSYPWVEIAYGNIKTTGTSSYSSAQTFKINNSLWVGDWIMKNSYIVGGSGEISSNNIFDVNVPATATISINSSYTANVKQCIFNSSKIASGATLAAQITQVTDEQLHSASYLNSIGFPIGVD